MFFVIIKSFAHDKIKTKLSVQQWFLQQFTSYASVTDLQCKKRQIKTAVSPRSAILLMSWCSPHLITYFKMSCSLACRRKKAGEARERILAHTFIHKDEAFETNDKLVHRHYFITLTPFLNYSHYSSSFTEA